MPFHFCADELMAIMYAAPFVGAGMVWVRIRIKRLFHRGCVHSDD